MIQKLIDKGAKIGRNVVIHESVKIVAKDIIIGDYVYIGPNTQIFANILVIGNKTRIGENCIFRSDQIEFGGNSRIGNNNDIQPHKIFVIGHTSHIGNNAHIRGRSIVFGDEVFITNGLRVGGGGRNEPEAVLTVGDRCTMHNNFINLARPVFIGNDVGFSSETILITHGYWQSVLEGYFANYAPITIHDGVILGMRVIILPGVEIGERTTVGAGAVVSRSLPARCVAVGVPARVIKTDYPSVPSKQEQDTIMVELLKDYKTHLIDRGFDVEVVEMVEGSILLNVRKDNITRTISYFRGPYVSLQALEGEGNILLSFNVKKALSGSTVMNLRTLNIEGMSRPLVHDLRDFLRRYGIRFYGYGFFESLLPQIAIDLEKDLYSEEDEKYGK
jgi:acetyltransferase-like isoleucine patch superfamily enzyme